MRIAVVGVGRIGQMHAHNVTATPGVDEVVLFDALPGRADKVAAMIAGTPSRAGGDGARVSVATSGLSPVLAGVDGVLIAGPTGTHPEVVEAAVEAGVPALVEKPLAGDIATVRRLIGRVEASGVPVLVGFQRRFDPATWRIKQSILSGEIGDVYYVRATAFDALPPPLEYIAGSGGIFRDLFVHDLDCVPWLVGRDVVEVQARGSVLVDPGFADAGDVDTAIVQLVFEGGVLAQLAGGRRQGTGYDCRLEVLGSRRAMAAGLDASTPLVSAEPGGPDPGPNAHPSFAERFAPAYAREIDVFLDVIAGRVKNPSPVTDSLVSLVLAEACEESLRGGVPVQVDPERLRP